MADDVVNGILTSSVVLGAGFGLARTIITNRRRAQMLEQAGICARCKGTGMQECQLCYGRGSCARPGYINVADPHHRAPCRRCDGFGRHSCGACGGAATAATATAATAAVVPASAGPAAVPPLLTARPEPPKLLLAAPPGDSRVAGSSTASAGGSRGSSGAALAAMGPRFGQAAAAVGAARTPGTLAAAEAAVEAAAAREDQQFWNDAAGLAGQAREAPFGAASAAAAATDAAAADAAAADAAAARPPTPGVGFVADNNTSLAADPDVRSGAAATGSVDRSSSRSRRNRDGGWRSSGVELIGSSDGVEESDLDF